MNSWELQFASAEHGEVLVLKPTRQLEGQDHAVLSRKLEELALAGRKRLVLDLSAAKYLRSTVLGVLLAHQQRLREAGGSLVLAAPEGAVTRVLRFANLGEDLPVRSTVEEAAKLAAAGPEPEPPGGPPTPKGP